MSISITSQVSSESFFIAAAAEPRPKQEYDAQKSTPLGRLPNDLGNVAVPVEGQNGECCVGGVDGTDALRGERILSHEEISRHAMEDDAWIVVDGKVYDVTQFLEIHPGGSELVLDYLASEHHAEDAGSLMRGKVNEDGHSHSKAAFRMLEQFLVGSVEETPAGSAQVEFEASTGKKKKKYRFNVDLRKPVVFQVGYLGDDYDEWVHDPVISKDSPRFFESDFAELFTRTKWWVVPLVWIPVALGMIYTAMVKENVPLSRMPALFAGGILLWTSMEYLIHRFLFHMKTSSFWGNTLHYLLHGFHHKHPMDSARLVFPPLFTVPVQLMIWICLGTWAASYPNKLVIYAFGLINYVIYDLTHYFLHFGTVFNEHSRELKRYHLNHHFKDQTLGFGITSPVWDIIFQSRPRDKPSMD